MVWQRCRRFVVMLQVGKVRANVVSPLLASGREGESHRNAPQSRRFRRPEIKSVPRKPHAAYLCRYLLRKEHTRPTTYRGIANPMSPILGRQWPAGTGGPAEPLVNMTLGYDKRNKEGSGGGR